MAPLRLLLAGSDQPALAALRRNLAPPPGHAPACSIVAEAADLSSAYLLAERTEPDIAILGSELALQPDFEGLLSVFRLLGTACLRLRPALAAAARIPPRGLPGPAGMPELDPALPFAELVTHLQQAQAAARGMPGPAGALPRPALSLRPASAAWASAPPPRADPQRLILIGASTGGIDALIQILSAFPADCPPTAIVQHTGPAFSASLIRLLGRCCPAQVQPAEQGAEVRPGTVTIGAGCAGHLRLAPTRPLRAGVDPGPPICGHIPSVDALFRSALPFGPSVSAALLTGMGRDGADGLLDLRRAGALTIAQDAETSVVYGMPRAAADLGAADLILPLGRIAAALLAPPPSASTPSRLPEARAT